MNKDQPTIIDLQSLIKERDQIAQFLTYAKPKSRRLGIDPMTWLCIFSQKLDRFEELNTIIDCEQTRPMDNDC